MKAVVGRRYGGPEVLAVEDVARPALGANEVLVRIGATSVTSGDARLRGFKSAGVFWIPLRLMFGILRPRNPVPGMEFSGQVEAVGDGVSSFRAGDAVFGMTTGGANAEYVAVRADGAIAARPAGLADEVAAAIPFGAMSALAFLRDIVRLKPGEKILIYGASGAVGVAAVQLAKHFGAEVTGVCSTGNLNLVRSLGADHVIDYTTTDFTKGNRVYDVILDTVGGTSFARAKRVLAPNGRHVFVNFKLLQLFQMFWTSLRRGKRVICGYSAGTSQLDLNLIKDLVGTRVLKPVIDRTYRLEQIAEAHRYVDSGRKRGSVILSLQDPSGNGAIGVRGGASVVLGWLLRKEFLQFVEFVTASQP